MVEAVGPSTGIKVLYECANALNLHDVLIDIVAVHGIGADPDRTWRTSDCQWLVDPNMLPSAIPKTRVMRFAYESQWLGSEAIQQRLPLVADQLLKSLLDLRRSCLDRPIIFIGHCFGGIVIQKAIINAKLHSSYYPGICNATSGVLFLGTPMRGTGSQSKAAMIASIASTMKFGEQSSLLNAVEKDSDMLKDLLHDFTCLVNVESIPLVCFFEQHKSDIAKIIVPRSMRWLTQKELMVDEESGCIDGFAKLGLAADHFNMHRYMGPDDGNYRLVRGELSRFAAAAYPRLAQRSDPGSAARSGDQATRRDQECLNAIFITDPSEDLAMIESKTDKVMKESNSWILSHPAWSRWLNEPDQSSLWIHGDPGKGKTFIAISAISELIEKQRLQGRTSRNPVLFFFCDAKDDRRNHALAIMRSLLHQLLSQRPDLVHILRAEYEKRKGHLLTSPTALHTLWAIFQEATDFEHIDSVTIVVDALDECEGESVSDFLALVQNNQSDDGSDYPTESEQGDDSTRSKWLLTSRNEDHIRQDLYDVLDISLEDNALYVSRSVQHYIRSRVSHLKKIKRYPESLAMEVQNTLQDKAEGTFLWVSLACRELSKPKVKAINTKNVLEKLPPGLSPLYDRIIEQVLLTEDQDLLEYGKAVLRTMVLAFRPLKLGEMAVAARLPVGLDEGPQMIMEYLELCSSIVTVRNGTAHFIHESAMAYIKSRIDIVSREPKVVHADIAMSCFQHLSSDIGQDDSNSEISSECSHTEGTMELPIYPTLFWLEHARIGFEHLEDQFLTGDFWDAESPTRKSWLDRYWPIKHAHGAPKPDLFLALHCAAYGGLTFMVKHLLDRVPQNEIQGMVHDRDSLGNDALIWAASGGWRDTVDLLIAHMADVRLTNDAGMSALCLAATNGHIFAVKSLVQAGAEVNYCDVLGTTLIHKVATQGHIPILNYLLASGSEVDGRDHLRWTPIQRACSSGNMSVVKALKEAGADLQQIDREGMSLLHYAASQGHTDVATYLLKSGVSINSKCYEQWTPLHEASWSGEQSTVAYLLKRGADTHQRNQEGHTPLHQASWNGHTDIVRLLLKAGADPNELCNDGETALHQAAWQNHIDIAQALFDAGSSLAVNVFGDSPIDHATANGSEQTAALLADTTAGGKVALERHDSLDPNPGMGLPPKTMTFESVHRNDLDPPVELDPAIMRALPGDPVECHASHHGHAGFSVPLKLRANYADGSTRHFFCKTYGNGPMFTSEFHSLQSMSNAMPLICTRPLLHGSMEKTDHYFLLTEFLDTGPDTEVPGSGLSMADKLARMHDQPVPMPDGYDEPMFGFPMQTFCGSTPQDNNFTASWAAFFAHNRLGRIASICEERHGADDELRQWIDRTITDTAPVLLRDGHLGGAAGIQPSLVHGDLWMGNRARGQVDGWAGVEDICFDPSSVYAHNEYEFAIMRLFGGFLAGFWAQYHRIKPKTEPVAEYEDRIRLYSVYHVMNHYALHAGGWREDAIEVMRELWEKHGRLYRQAASVEDAAIGHATAEVDVALR